MLLLDVPMTNPTLMDWLAQLILIVGQRSSVTAAVCTVDQLVTVLVCIYVLLVDSS